MNNNGKEIQQDEISLKEIVLFIWQKKYIIVGVAFLFTVLSVFYAITADTRYQSSAKLITKTSSEKGGNLAQMAALAGIDVSSPSGNADPSEYLPEVIKEGSFLEKIINRKWYYNGDSLFLEDIWEMTPDTAKENWKYRYYRSKINRLRSSDVINLSKDSKTGLMTLTTEFGGPYLAYNINKYILELLGDYIKTTLKSQAKEKRKFIEERMEEAKQELNSSEAILARYKESHVGSTAPRVLMEEQRLMRRVMINQELYKQLRQQYEMARIQEKNDQPLIEVIRQPELPVKPSKPNKRLIVLLGGFSGLFAGLFLSLLWHWFMVNFREQT